MNRPAVIAVTRPDREARAMGAMISKAGARPLLVPLLAIRPPHDGDPLREALQDLTRFDLVLFTSRNAVRSVMGQVKRRGEECEQAFRSLLVGAVGAQTALELGRFGVEADLVPPSSGGDSLVALLRARLDLRGRPVLLPQVDGARPGLGAALEAAGAGVERVCAYRIATGDRARAEDLEKELLNGRVDVVTFASGTAVLAFVQLVGEVRARCSLEKAALAVLGGSSQRALGRLGLGAGREASEMSVRGLVDAALWASRGVEPGPERSE